MRERLERISHHATNYASIQKAAFNQLFAFVYLGSVLAVLAASRIHNGLQCAKLNIGMKNPAARTSAGLRSLPYVFDLTALGKAWKIEGPGGKMALHCLVMETGFPT